MGQRLSPLDASFLFAEHRTAAMHVGAVMTFAPPEDGSFDADAFVELIGHRLALVPQYRRKLREVPGGLGLPVWVDDPDFDLAFHVRRSALPAPGTEDVLRELVGRLLSTQLDRSRPLWEVYLVEGLVNNGADGGIAVVTKTHHAMVDGMASMDIGTALLDLTAVPRETPADDWRPAPEPSPLELAATAAGEALRRPRLALDRAGRAASDLPATVATVGRAVQQMMATGRSMASVRPVSTLNGSTGQQRRYGMVRTSLADHRAVRRRYGGTVNDVMLAVVAGGLRRWMLERGDELPEAVRALVPVSVRARDRCSEPGNRISACLLDLPIGEPDPAARLAAVQAAMAAQKRDGHAAGTTSLLELAGLAPPLVYGLGARLASQYSSRFYNVLVTNVPGPPRPLYAMGARMRDMFPVVPLAGGQAVAVGITTYDGVAHYGLTADRDAAPDVDHLAAALSASLDELLSD